MLSNALKLLLLAIALVCVAIPESEDFPRETEAHDVDVEVVETKGGETDNVTIDDLVKKQIKFPPILTPFCPRCPFDCGSVCVVKYPFTWGHPPITYVFYLCHYDVYICCKKACCKHQTCVKSNKPSWACYTDTLDMLCKCRRKAKPNIILKVKEKKGKY